ncbi:SEC-C domain-containing protein [Evansella sp. AB-P1]|uniref:SEC-C domain-containing protein n=1 Tax=Evansella sp. AB-P1 TaxID=3037653 RepID=UPI00241C26B8|nr:SEC-C domain-containing protein [Evansella sp. AB-P1]MDG5789709.1 SEC-C domain-containing protein [Evansella sp. AB-P1]
MVANRNQPCPCGSGKKYKKCCMEKTSIIDLHKRSEEKFYDQKDTLVKMITDFIGGKIDAHVHERLLHIFTMRSGNNIDEDAKSMMFHFFTLFMHRFDNGLRGVEWFYKDKGSKLNSNIRAMAKEWTSLPFRLVHAVEKTDEIYIFEDVITKNTFQVPNIRENIPENLEIFDGTIGLLELHNNKYYFNGVRVYMAPKHVDQAKGKIESLMNKTGLSYEEVMIDYTLEVLAAMLNKDGNRFKFTDKDVSILEELGLEHLPDYAMDFLSFYKEKTVGKKGNTVRKYRESLHDLNEVLKRNHYQCLADIDEEGWRKLLSKEYFDMYETMTKTQITDLISTIKAMSQWMKKNKKATLLEELTAFLKQEESQFINGVQLPYSFSPNRTGNVGVTFHEMAKLITGQISAYEEAVEGVFEIISCNKKSFRVLGIRLTDGSVGKPGEEYTITGADIQMDYVEDGLIFSGKIAKGRRNIWELLEINKGYPRTAKEFLQEEDYVRML